MENNNIFAKTRFSNLEQELNKHFTNHNPSYLYEDACRIYKKELKDMNDRQNIIIKNHLQRNILPGYACYRALFNAGIDREVAVKFVEMMMCNSAKPMGNLCGKLSRKPYIYALFRLLFGLIMKIGYPEKGWKINWLENNQNRVRFDIQSCLYCEELEKRNALELCPAFCKTDHTSYDPLAPGVRFTRKGTLAEGNKVCDFCFEKGYSKII